MPSTDPRELKAYDPAHELVPLNRWDAQRNGKPVGKAPRDPGWRKAAYKREDVEAWAAKGGNVGFRMRRGDVVLDVDRRNFPAGRDSLRELVDALGLDLDQYPHVVTGSGGHHYYMSIPQDAELRITMEQYPGLEMKGHGYQVVAAGSVHPSGGVYRWDDFGPRPAATTW